MKKILSLVLFVSLFCCVSNAQVDAAYTSKLKHLFEVSGTSESYKSAVTQMITMFKQQYTDVSSDVWAEFESEFLKTSLDELTQMLVPVYNKYLTSEDLDGLISFYLSPAGAKYAKVTPFITQESMQVGQEWGMKLGQAFAEKMEKRK